MVVNKNNNRTSSHTFVFVVLAFIFLIVVVLAFIRLLTYVPTFLILVVVYFSISLYMPLDAAWCWCQHCLLRGSRLHGLVGVLRSHRAAARGAKHYDDHDQHACKLGQLLLATVSAERSANSHAVVLDCRL